MENKDYSGSAANASPSNNGQTATPARDVIHPNSSVALIELILSSVNILKAQRRVFFAIATLIFVGAIVASYVRSPKFEARAKIMVQLDMQTVILSQSDVRYNLAMQMADEAVATEAELLHSSDLIERVIDQVGENVLDGKPKKGMVALVMGVVSGITSFASDTLTGLGLLNHQSPRQILAQKIIGGLKILPVRKSQMIDISLRLKNQQATQIILAALIEQHIKTLAKMDSASLAYSIYREQASQLNSELKDGEQAIAQFKVKYDFVDLSAEKATLLRNIARLTAVLDGLQSNSGVDLAENSNDNFARLVSRVDDLRIESERRSALYQSGHVKLDEINMQLKMADQLLAKKVTIIRKAVAGYQARSKLLDAVEPEYNRLLREEAVREENYSAYLKASESRRLASDRSRKTTLTVIDPPSVPEAAIAPTRLVLILGGLFGGLMLATFWILFSNWWSTRIRSMREQGQFL